MRKLFFSVLFVLLLITVSYFFNLTYLTNRLITNNSITNRLITNNFSKKTYDIKNSIPTVTPSIVTLLISGDVMLGRTIMSESRKLADPIYPFRNTGEYLRSADFTFVNLENPIIQDCPIHSGGFKFCSGLDSFNGLSYAGIDIVNLANNHTGNYGQAGIDETVKHLTNNGISYTGLNNLIIKKLNNLTIGFLGFDFTVNIPTQKDLNLIKESDLEVDYLIVSVHWGVEYKAVPEKYQRQWARQMIDDGADVIVGHHPHWVQGVDCIKEESWEYLDREIITNELLTRNCEKLVFYSLGNLVFDQQWSEETKKGLLVKLEIGEKAIKIIELSSTYTEKIGQPILAISY